MPRITPNVVSTFARSLIAAMRFFCASKSSMPYTTFAAVGAKRAYATRPSSGEGCASEHTATICDLESGSTSSSVSVRRQCFSWRTFTPLPTFLVSAPERVQESP